MTAYGEDPRRLRQKYEVWKTRVMGDIVKIIPVRQGLQHVAIRFLLPSGPLASTTVLWPTTLVFPGVPPRLLRGKVRLLPFSHRTRVASRHSCRRRVVDSSAHYEITRRSVLVHVHMASISVAFRTICFLAS